MLPSIFVYSYLYCYLSLPVYQLPVCPGIHRRTKPQSKRTNNVVVVRPCLLDPKKFLDFDLITLSFLFNKHCLIIE